jgi:AcrR family transcriptional regulator
VNIEQTTEQKILTRIARYIFRYGFSALTMEGAAEYAQVSKRTLYKRYPNKDAMLIAVVEFQVSRFEAILSSIINDETSACLSKLQTIIPLLADFARRFPPALLRDLQRDGGGVWDTIQRLRRERIYPLLQELLLQAREEGFLRTEIGPALLTELLFTTIEGIANPSVLSRLPFEPREIFSGLFDVFFNGILRDRGQPLLSLSDDSPYKETLEALF